MSKDKTGLFAWYELLTTDVAAAIGFYSKVVGWTTRPFSDGKEPYTMWVNGESPIGGVMTLPEEAKQMGAPPHWMAHVFVADVDASVEQARSLGAEVYVPPTDVPTVGRFSVIADPTGAVISLFKDERGEMQAPSGKQDGEFSWHELLSTDPDRSWAFYSAMFGWEKRESTDMGPMGTYQTFGLGDRRFGGLMRVPPGWQGDRSAWMYYASVPRLSAAVDAVKASGGEVQMGPMEVPGGGHMIAGKDPQGAAFALFSLAP